MVDMYTMGHISVLKNMDWLSASSSFEVTANLLSTGYKPFAIDFTFGEYGGT